ncbi:TPA: ead/Ea22-like family protein [Klebsiella pneumoniae]|nr:ead/Ea22-like family protein [Klebsiella pneumoniae]
MSDITELAQSLKAAAIDAKELAIIARYSKGRAAAEKFYALANPNNVLALVEALENSESRLHEVAVACATAEQALEKAQQQMTESENRVRKQNRHICELFDDNTALRQRIAELESRTVKLPKPISVLHRREFTAAHCAIYAYPEAEVNAALDDAGIKVEAE